MKVSATIWLISSVRIVSKHFKMYIIVNDVIGEKRIDLAYPIQGKEVAVVIMLSDNVQYWLKEPMKVLLKKGKKKVLTKGVYTDKELNAMIGLELKSQMDSRDYVLKENKLENVTKMAIRLDELNNTNNLEDRKPSNTLYTYYVSSPEYFTHFKPVTLQYKKFKNGMIVSLTLKITDQNGNIITNVPGTTVVLHIR